MCSYQAFLRTIDNKIEKYFTLYNEYIFCKRGCTFCCENGDYPLSQLELEYLMQGYIALDNNIKIQVQNNIKNMQKGGKCPFLIKNECSVYNYRPIICRVHGLAYICKDNIVKLPYCVNYNLNYAKYYNNEQIQFEPIDENLDTTNILKDLNYGEIKNLYDWLIIQ